MPRKCLDLLVSSMIMAIACVSAARDPIAASNDEFVMLWGESSGSRLSFEYQARRRAIQRSKERMVRLRNDQQLALRERAKRVYAMTAYAR